MNHEEASYTCQTNVSSVEVTVGCCSIFFFLCSTVASVIFKFQPIHCHGMGIFSSLPFDLYLIQVQKCKVLVT